MNYNDFQQKVIYLISKFLVVYNVASDWFHTFYSLAVFVYTLNVSVLITIHKFLDILVIKKCV